MLLKTKNKQCQIENYLTIIPLNKEKEVKEVIKSLNKKKSVISSCFLVKVLIDSVDTYLPIFTEELKLAEVTPLFQKTDPFDKVNYRPVSLLSHVSKVYEDYFQSNKYIL